MRVPSVKILGRSTVIIVSDVAFASAALESASAGIVLISSVLFLFVVVLLIRLVIPAIWIETIFRPFTPFCNVIRKT